MLVSRNISLLVGNRNKCYHMDRIFFGGVSELTDIKDIISFFFEVRFQFGVGCIMNY
jgi:hypothetical protein